MKFTVGRKAPVKMLQCVGKKAPSQKRREKQVRLSACAARVFVEANQTTDHRSPPPSDRLSRHQHFELRQHISIIPI
jgi:hypothetical protein